MTKETARRILRELAEMCEHASLTGAMRGGESRAAARYNSVLEELEDEDMITEGIFQPFNTEEATFGQLAVDTRLLLAGLKDSNDDDDDDEDERGDGKGLGALIALAPFLHSEDLAKLVKERISSSTKINDGLLVGLAPFLDANALGDLLRMGDRPKTPAPPTPPTTPEPPTPPSRDIISHESHGSRLPEVAPNEELARLAARLAHPDISSDERSQIAVRLSELALQQGQMARE